MQKKIERPMVAKALHERKRKSQQREYRKKQTPFSFMSLRRMFEDKQINVSMRTILTHILFEFKTYYDTLALLAKNMIYFVTNTITSIAASYFRREDPYT